MRKIREVLRLHFDCNFSHRQIATSCSISRSTVADYVYRARVAGLTWPLPEGKSDSDLDRLLFPEPKRKGKYSLPDFAALHVELRKKGATLALEWETYKNIHPDGYGHSQFCELYRRWVRTLNVVMRQEHRAGEKLFSDFAGEKLEVTSPGPEGKKIKVSLFVCALGASSFAYAEAFWSEKSEAWCLGHAHAFENYFKGVVEVVVPDNPKPVIKKPCRYEPDVHTDFQNMASYFGVAVIPARVARPKDKGKVEAAVKLANRWIIRALKKRTFYSLAELNVAIREQVDMLNDRRFNKIPESRRSLFEKLEKPILKPLPAQPYEYVQIGYANVSSLDYHVRIDDHFYSVPYTLVKKKIEYRLTHNVVEILYNGVRVASHVRSIHKYRHTTLKEHMPEAHQQYLEWTPKRVRDCAVRIGPQATQLVELLLTRKEFPQQAFRSCLGVVRLSKKYGDQALEKACGIAIGANALSYKSVELILKNNAECKEKSTSSKPRVSLIHENVRGAHYFNTNNTEEHNNDDTSNPGDAERTETHRYG